MEPTFYKACQLSCGACGKFVGFGLLCTVTYRKALYLAQTVLFIGQIDLILRNRSVQILKTSWLESHDFPHYGNGQPIFARNWTCIQLFFSLFWCFKERRMCYIERFGKMPHKLHRNEEELSGYMWILQLVNNRSLKYPRKTNIWQCPNFYFQYAGILF